MTEDAGTLWDAVLARGVRRAASARATRCGSRSAIRCTGTTSGPTPTRSPQASGGPARSTKEFTGARRSAQVEERGPGAAARRVRDGGAARSPARGWRSTAAGRSPRARTRRCSTSESASATCRASARRRTELTIDVRGKPRRARDRAGNPSTRREGVTWRPRSLPRRPQVPPRARLGARRRRRGRRSASPGSRGLARRARALRAARRRARPSRRTRRTARSSR